MTIDCEMACTRNISVDRNLQAREVLGPLGNLQLEPYLVRKLKNTQRFIGHAGTVNSISWSLDGSTVLSAGEDSKMNLWNVQHSGKGKVLQSFDTVSLGLLWPLMSAWGSPCVQSHSAFLSAHMSLSGTCRCSTYARYCVLPHTYQRISCLCQKYSIRSFTASCCQAVRWLYKQT